MTVEMIPFVQNSWVKRVPSPPWSSNVACTTPRRSQLPKRVVTSLGDLEDLARAAHPAEPCGVARPRGGDRSGHVGDSSQPFDPLMRSVQVRPQIKDLFPWRPHLDNEAMVTHACSIKRPVLQRAVMISRRNNALTRPGRGAMAVRGRAPTLVEMPGPKTPTVYPRMYRGLSHRARQRAAYAEPARSGVWLNELRVMILPVVIGAGKRLLAGSTCVPSSWLR